MIKVTQLDGEPVWINEIQMLHKPKSWEHAGGCSIQLITGNAIVVKETPEEVLRKIVESATAASRWPTSSKT